MRSYNYADAILLLRPEAVFTIHKNEYSTLEWYDVEQSKPSEEEINAKIAELQAAEPLRLLRIQRDQLLAQTDYITLRAYSQGQAVPQEWADYMQALRDLPETVQPELDENGNLTNVEWPTKPSESV
jgi:elongation factor P--beta-lysine ligase